MDIILSLLTESDIIINKHRSDVLPGVGLNPEPVTMKSSALSLSVNEVDKHINNKVQTKIRLSSNIRILETLNFHKLKIFRVIGTIIKYPYHILHNKIINNTGIIPHDLLINRGFKFKEIRRFI